MHIYTSHMQTSKASNNTTKYNNKTYNAHKVDLSVGGHRKE